MRACAGQSRGGKGQQVDMIDMRQTGQLWHFLLGYGLCVRGLGYGVAVMQGRGRERGVMRGGPGGRFRLRQFLNGGFELIQGAVRARMPPTLVPAAALCVRGFEPVRAGRVNFGGRGKERGARDVGRVVHPNPLPILVEPKKFNPFLLVLG